MRALPGPPVNPTCCIHRRHRHDARIGRRIARPGAWTVVADSGDDRDPCRVRIQHRALDQQVRRPGEAEVDHLDLGRHQRGDGEVEPIGIGPFIASSQHEGIGHVELCRRQHSRHPAIGVAHQQGDHRRAVFRTRRGGAHVPHAFETDIGVSQHIVLEVHAGIDHADRRCEQALANRRRVTGQCPAVADLGDAIGRRLIAVVAVGRDER